MRRIFFGSDGISPPFFRGGYFALDRSWGTIDGNAYGEERFPHCDGRPILAIYEDLLAIKQAAEIAGFGVHFDERRAAPLAHLAQCLVLRAGPGEQDGGDVDNLHEITRRQLQTAARVGT